MYLEQDLQKSILNIVVIKLDINSILQAIITRKRVRMKNKLIYSIIILFLGSIFLLAYSNFSKNYNFILTDGKTIDKLRCNTLKLNPKNNLIFLGETTHGSEDVKSLENCIMKYFIHTKKRASIVLEWSYTSASYLNLYVHNSLIISKSQIESLINSTYFKSKAFYEFIDWAKDQNTHGADIEFWGIDNQDSDMLIGLLSDLNEPEFDEIKSCLRESFQNNIKNNQKCNLIALNYTKNKTPDISKKDYFFWLFQRSFDLSKFQFNLIHFNYFRDLFMFNTFQDIYNYKLKTNNNSSIIVLAHTGHILNFKNRFGWYAQKTFRISTYIVSLCAGKIKMYSYGFRKYVDTKISTLDNDLIEYNVCSNRLFNKKENSKILNYGLNFGINYSIKIPDYNFEGFFVVPNSEPLDFRR